MRVDFLDIDGIRSRILHAGDGEGVLLIHGVGTTAERWVRNIDSIGQNFNVVAPDLVSCGFSSNSNFTQSYPQEVHVAQILGIIEQRGFKKVSVVGSSYGGLIATLLTLQQPAIVNRLVIVGSGSALHPAEEQAKVLTASRVNGLKAMDDGTLAGTRRRMENIVYDPLSVPAESLLVQLTSNALPGRREAATAMYDRLIEALRHPEIQAFPKLEEISVPTLIVTGRDDIRSSWELARAAAKRIPNCRLEIFEDCGHGPMFEHAEEFNRLVVQFLTQG